MLNVFMVIGLVLLALWLLGLVTSTTLGGFVYLALVIGVILIVVGFVTNGRRRV